MSPEEVKAYADIAVTVMSAGGITSIILAVIGAKKAKKEREEESDKPSIGLAGMAGIGGMLASDNHVHVLVKAIEALAFAYTSASERSRSEAEADRATARRLVEELGELNSALRKMSAKLRD